MTQPAFTKRGRVWTRQENDRIAELYESGVSPTEIAKLFGVSRMSIESKLHCWGIRRPKRVWTEREMRRAIELRAAGLTQAEIGRVLGRSPKAVEHGFKIIGGRDGLSTSA